MTIPSKTVPLRWHYGQKIGTATVYANGRVEATITDVAVRDIFSDSLVGLSLGREKARPIFKTEHEYHRHDNVWSSGCDGCRDEALAKFERTNDAG